MNKPRLLDLFCGAGGAAMGYHRAGFDVVGVDIKPQPHYPFEFHQADALTYPLEGFEAYHASPPCQYYSRLRHLPWIKDKKYWRSVPPTLALLNKINQPWVLENVEDCWDMPGSVVICGSSIGLSLYRHRRFLMTFPIFLYPHQKHRGVIAPGRASLSKRHSGTQGFCEISRESIAGHKGDAERSREIMGIGWMNRDELSQAIPPCYTCFIGGYLLSAVRGGEHQPFDFGRERRCDTCDAHHPNSRTQNTDALVGSVLHEPLSQSAYSVNEGCSLDLKQVPCETGSHSEECDINGQ